MVPYFRKEVKIKTATGTRINKNVLYYGDAIEIPDRIIENSVHCVVTSPPYWGKVDYLEGEIDQLGLDKTPDLYIQRLVTIFRGIKKVLHPTGVVWLNIGDTYCVPSTKRETILGMKPGVSAKNRIGIPWRLALALQKDGWWLRQDNIWYRRNAPREPVKDRPTTEHEHVFLLTKRSHYFYDQTAVYQELKAGDRYAGDRRKITTESGGMFHGGHNRKAKLAGKNLGSVWDIPTQGRTDSHYAAFPDKLIIQCINAGTSFRGCCSTCKAPFTPVIERENEDVAPKIIDWKATCKCGTSIESCVVLDPFMGRGTTAMMAERLNRRWIGTDKSAEFCELIKQNLTYRESGLRPPIEPAKGFFNLTRKDVEIY